MNSLGMGVAWVKTSKVRLLDGSWRRMQPMSNHLQVKRNKMLLLNLEYFLLKFYKKKHLQLTLTIKLYTWTIITDTRTWAMISIPNHTLHWFWIFLPDLGNSSENVKFGILVLGSFGGFFLIWKLWLNIHKNMSMVENFVTCLLENIQVCSHGYGTV